MKKPAIIDQEIEFTVYSHAMITPPMEVEDYNPDDPAELIYASAMDFITEGRTEQRRKDLDLHSAYRLGSWRAGNTLAYGLSVGWFGERDYPAHLVVLRNLVEQESSGAMSNLGFAYEHGLGLQKSLRWAVYWYEKAVSVFWKKNSRKTEGKIRSTQRKDNKKALQLRDFRYLCNL